MDHASPQLSQFVSAALAVALGAVLGAWLRWGLAVWLNGQFPSLPPGTLIANLAGGYLIGVVIALLAQQPALPPEWRLFLVTGFLGALTTFSTFSAEVVGLLHQGRLGWALLTVTTHVLGSLAMTLAGLATPMLLRR
ncbi:MAG: fluoride efflux transporter CrcB [Burkholderiales bacterium]|nr:fluoride efflux transporter CrcB [Burkholderiales bacterium]